MVFPTLKLFIGILNHFSCSSHHSGPWVTSGSFAFFLSLLGIVVELFAYLLEVAAIIIGAAVHVLASLEQLTKVFCGIVHLILFLDLFQVRCWLR